MVLKPKKMSHLTTTSKIMKFVNQGLSWQLKVWKELLVKGDLYAYEKALSHCMNEMYNFISEELLPEACCEVGKKLVRQSTAAGGGKFEMRPLTIRIGTGRQIGVQSPYAKRIGKDWIGPRHLVAGYWGIIGGASPALYDKVGYCSAVGPSYEVAHQTLSKFGVDLCQSSVRAINNRLASRCYEAKEENLMLSGYSGDTDPHSGAC